MPTYVRVLCYGVVWNIVCEEDQLVELLPVVSTTCHVCDSSRVTEIPSLVQSQHKEVAIVPQICRNLNVFIAIIPRILVVVLCSGCSRRSFLTHAMWLPGTRTGTQVPVVNEPNELMHPAPPSSSLSSLFPLCRLECQKKQVISE